MNIKLLNLDNQSFINKNINAKASRLILKGHKSTTATIQELVEQIEAKQKAKLKLPTWFNTANIYYPNKLNIEQTSSEITAQYKASFIKGNTLIDATGGFGIDAYYFSKQVANVTHCELNTKLSHIVSHNYKVLNALNINTINANGIEYIINGTTVFDWIYIDPSRRHDTKGKVFYLNDCLPNVPKHLDELFKKAKNILLKVSPMLDISVGIAELNHIKNIHIIALKGEVKELLFELSYEYDGSITMSCVNILHTQIQQFSFKKDTEKELEIAYTLPQKYLYEPNAAILKAGAFNNVAQQFKLNKLHKHTHLYTSNQLIEFPGRTFKILEVLPFDKKIIKKKFGQTKANISTRNFPITVQQLKTKFKIKDGGDTYLFFITNAEHQKVSIVAEKVN